MCPASSLIPGREQLLNKNLLKGFQALELYIFNSLSFKQPPINFFLHYLLAIYNLHNKSII